MRRRRQLGNGAPRTEWYLPVITEHTHTRVGGTQVDTDSGSHCDGLWCDGKGGGEDGLIDVRNRGITVESANAVAKVSIEEGNADEKEEI